MYYIKNYIPKRKTLDTHGGIDIPSNDYEAYDKYKNLRHLYNKLYISKSQDLSCGIYKKEVNTLPIIIRPIINLQGMGRGLIIAKYFKDIQIPKKYFWCEYLTGEHLSYDIFINSFGIQDIIVFKGYPAEKGKFDVWEYVSRKLPKNIKNWIYKNIKQYNGVINIETIGNNIIECHLRMGDCNMFQSDAITKNIIECYKNNKIKKIKLKKIFLIPIFVSKGKHKMIDKSIIVKSINLHDNNWNSIITYQRCYRRCLIF